MQPNQTISFIGGGNMARSLIRGLILDGWSTAHVWVADPDPAQLKLIIEQCGAVHTTADNLEAARAAQILVLAVKPQILWTVIKSLAEAVQAAKPLVISVAAGVRTEDINRWLGTGLAIVRAMPNTPALVQSSATALFANLRVTAEQHDLAERIMRAVGLALWVETEDQLDVVTAVSGSGPAYFLLVMGAIEQAALMLGLPPNTARLLILQTALGTAKLALESAEDVTTLRHRVTSKGGTTERALAVLEAGNLQALFQQALQAAVERSRELATQQET